MESLPDIHTVSVLLSRLLEREILGSREIIDFRRRNLLGHEYIFNTNDNQTTMFCGSQIEGVSQPGSDNDYMIVDKLVEVMYPGQRVSPDSRKRTVLRVKEADCRPGYVTLQLCHLGQNIHHELIESLVPVGNATFVSSDMYREYHIKVYNIESSLLYKSNGPGVSTGMADYVYSLPCNSWPREAVQWATRPHLYGWPTQALIDKAVQNGCHFVPVGDKCSDDTFLQWRLSFVSTERLLVHSFSHIHMKVYFLLKFFLEQLKSILRNIFGNEDDDILCSYHLKTLVFFSLENSHPKLWQEQNLFYCFWFCFNILISYVRAGHFPHYFIPTNNLFERKVHGQNQRKLFDILDRFHKKKLLCLSKDPWMRYREIDILERVCNVEMQAKLMHAQTVQEIEYTQDMFVKRTAEECWLLNDDEDESILLMTKSINLLLKSHSEVDEVLSFMNIASLVSYSASLEAHQNLASGLTNNKTRYRTLRKCQHRFRLGASMGTNVLYLATLHFLTGNYLNALRMCKQITSQPLYFLCDSNVLPEKEAAMYVNQYCGKGYTSFYKLKKTFAQHIVVNGSFMHLPHLDLEALRNKDYFVVIAPLSYALFLSFLCCHELKHKRGCDLALRDMKLVSLDECQRSRWIVHTMLGICYETIGDYPRAIRAYQDSADKPVWRLEQNPALERIAALRGFIT